MLHANGSHACSPNPSPTPRFASLPIMCPTALQRQVSLSCSTDSHGTGINCIFWDTETLPINKSQHIHHSKAAPHDFYTAQYLHLVTYQKYH